MNFPNTQLTPIQRIKEFVAYLVAEGKCKGNSEFERICGLSPNYIANNSNTGKGNIGSEMLGRMVTAYPELNLVWVCTGRESMIVGERPYNRDWQKAYQGAMMQVEALNSIIRSCNPL